MRDIIIFGAPGSGKGTQSEFLVNHYGLTHVSTGDLLRKEIADGTPLGCRIKSIMDNGGLVSDDIVVEMIGNVVANDTHGVLFDGFPRTVAQAEALDKLLASRQRSISCLISLDVPQDELIKRMLLRAATSGRSDDNEATIKNRLLEYESKTKPVAEHYRKQNKLISICGTGSIESIAANIAAAVDKL